MNFDQLAIPPSANHVLLLKYILTISMLLFLPYLGMILGASTLSVYFKRKYFSTGNKVYSFFSKDVLEKLTFSKHALIGLGIIPLLSILFCYAQLLAGAGADALTYILYGVDIFILAFIFIYVYRNAYLHGRIITSVENVVSGNNEINSKKEMEDFRALGTELETKAKSSGFWGIILLFIAAYVFISGTSFASEPYKWKDAKNILEILFSWNTIFGYLYLLSASGAITGSAILFYFFKWQGGLKEMSDEYSQYAKNFGIILTLVSSITLPLLLFFSFIFVPQEALSISVFIYYILLLAAILVLCNLLYMMFKNSDISFATAVFFLVFIIFGFNILKDQLALGNALKEQTTELIAKSEEHENEMKSKLTVVSNVDPQQIFDTKCMACHKFDVKLVGPPYNETVPTFHGDVNALSDFIYNPSSTPKNAGYPPMPNQGLKKGEAMAMAKWLIEKVGKK